MKYTDVTFSYVGEQGTASEGIVITERVRWQDLSNPPPSLPLLSHLLTYLQTKWNLTTPLTFVACSGAPSLVQASGSIPLAAFGEQLQLAPAVPKAIVQAPRGRRRASPASVDLARQAGTLVRRNPLRAVFSRRELGEARRHLGVPASHGAAVARGRDAAQVDRADEALAAQLVTLRNGTTPARLDRPAAVGDGIIRLDETSTARAIATYRAALASEEQPIRVVKFVPASGAATRMFKELVAHLDELQAIALEHVDDPAAASAALAAAEGRFDAKNAFFERVDEFPFTASLRSALAERGTTIERSRIQALETLLLPLPVGGLGLASAPKAVIPFHTYDLDEQRSALAEQFEEAVRYAVGADRIARLHFTVAADWLDAFRAECTKLAELLNAERGIRFEVSFSVQSPATDTLAANPDGTPFRDADTGKILFRPGGHGALLANLETVTAGHDLVFIKNIDNVTPDRLRGDTIRYKEALAGVLLESLRARGEAQDQLAAALDAAAATAADAAVADAEDLLESRFHVTPPASLADADFETRLAYVTAKLDRPVRVCGMVRNTGEPGGGPFWVTSADGSSQLQIVESAQIGEADAHLLAAGTHFNPTDLVVAAAGMTSLRRFVDDSAAFVTTKSHQGRSLRALELPGLWNGSMADWLTIFVEVPESTFTPVKTVNDLLREEHKQIL